MNSKRGLLIIILVSFCLLIKAQDADDSIPALPKIDLDTNVVSLQIDSFYKLRSIDLHQADSIGLYTEIYQWYRTRYHYGGNSKQGIDCSHFVNMLYEKIYNRTVGPSAGAILSKCKILKKGLAAAKEGDILFFKIKKGQISHVGIYLQNNKFAHASVHAGVIISDMDEPYYKRHFYKVGRVEQKD